MTSASIAIHVAREFLQHPPRPDTKADFDDVEVGRQMLRDMLADVRKLQGDEEPDLLGDALLIMVFRLAFDGEGRAMVMCGILRELQATLRFESLAEAVRCKN